MYVLILLISATVQLCIGIGFAMQTPALQENAAVAVGNEMTFREVLGDFREVLDDFSAHLMRENGNRFAFVQKFCWQRPRDAVCAWFHGIERMNDEEVFYSLLFKGVLPCAVLTDFAASRQLFIVRDIAVGLAYGCLIGCCFMLFKRQCINMTRRLQGFLYSLCYGDCMGPLFQIHPESCTILEDNCLICRDGIGDAVGVGSLRCGHVFHYECIKTWLESSGRYACPLCQKSI